MVDSTKDVRSTAAFLIERHGWTQNAVHNQGEGLTVFGAISQACKDTMLRTQVLRELRKELGQNIWVWHDSPVRTKNEVLKALRGMK